MKALSHLATRRPWLVLGIWLALVGALALKGVGVEERLHRTSLTVSGAGQEANELGADRFGDFASLTVLLEGPIGDLERQGPRLVDRIEREEGVTVLSPWSRGSGGDSLRPDPDRALVIVRVERPFEQISRDSVPALRKIVDSTIGEPVDAYLTGAPDIAAGIHGGTLDALHRAELLAAPMLLLVLLFVFRGPVAAGLTLAIGVMTIGAATGVVDLLNLVIDLDSVALSIGSMLGLALAVDYSLLVVSRFREEMPGAASSQMAARRAIETAGHTVLFAGIALLIASSVSMILAPGGLLASAATGSLVAVGLSVLASMTALPAALSLLGPRIDMWQFGRDRGTAGSERWAGMALRALRRPAIAGAAVAAGLVALSAPALALDSGPPDPRSLPRTAPERRDYQAVRDALGAGWMAPYDVVIAAREGTITEPERLAAIDRWQKKVSEWSGVAAVFGPGRIADRAKELDEVPAALERGRKELERGERGQKRLVDGLRRVDEGVDQLSAGLATAADGAARIRRGGDSASAGTAQLANGLSAAGRGAASISEGLETAGDGAQALSSGARRALSGTRRLRAGLSEAQRGTAGALPSVGQLADGLSAARRGADGLREPAGIADEQLRLALEALERMAPTSKLDPEYRRALEAVGTASAAITGRDPRDGSPVRPGYDGLDAALRELAEGLGRAETGVGALLGELRKLNGGLERLAGGAGDLAGGLRQLNSGADRLEKGLARLRSGGTDLQEGLRRLSSGAETLDAGTERLAGGAGELAGGLSEGAARSRELGRGVSRIESGVVSARVRTRELGKQLEGGDELSRLTRSGHFLLAALETAPKPLREASSFAVNLKGGGSAARITVVASDDPTRAGHPLRQRLQREAANLGGSIDAASGVGGAAPVFQDFDARTSERLPILIAALVLVTYLVLIPIFRSLVLPAIAVLLNVATVMAAFGVMSLAFQGDQPLAGGPGFLDAIMVIGIFSIVFGLSIDYAVFLIARMREGRDITGTTDGAIEYGLKRTARVITGAALIMSSAFVALATTEISTLRQFGVGLTVAVLLDATVVRLVLLPALIKMCGEASWWMPSWLERVLPAQGPPAPPPRPH